MAVILVYISVLSNFLAVFVVLLCLLGMMGYIYRQRGDITFSLSSVTYVNHPRIQRDMVRVEIPFSLSIASKESDGSVLCKMSNTVPLLLRVFWGVNIAELHTAFNLPWDLMRQQMLDTDAQFLSGCSFKIDPVTRFESCSDHPLLLQQPSDFNASTLGNIPRTKYPVAVIIVRDTDLATPSSVVAMLTVIHIEDPICQMKTCILFQYLKQACGSFAHLQPLYVAGSEESYEVINQQSVPSSLTCVVCQTKQVSMALLPCRHTCICSECFTKLDKCPMCRSSITSYFFLEDAASS